MTFEPLPRLVFPTPGRSVGDHKTAPDEAFAEVHATWLLPGYPRLGLFGSFLFRY
jgi:hypothetical protein